MVEARGIEIVRGQKTQLRHPAPPCVIVRSEAKHIIWSPEDAFTHRARPIAAIDDYECEQACEWYSDAMMAKSSDAPALKLINEIAAELAKLDWSRIAPVTKDFVVFAVALFSPAIFFRLRPKAQRPLI